jgi:hypothetical protein
MLTTEIQNAQPAASSGRESLQDVTDQASLSELEPRIQAVLSEIAGSENNILHQRRIISTASRTDLSTRSTGRFRKKT